MNFPSSSSARPRGPPSENIGAASDDEGDAFADDQVPRSSRIPNTANVPRVEDSIGLLVQEHFQAFIERYLSLRLSLYSVGNSLTTEGQ